MVKIGILTFSFSINYGAYLQAFSLQKSINEKYNFWAKAEIINYNSKRALDFYTCKNDSTDNQKYEAFEKCWALFPLSDGSIITDDLDKVSEYIKSKKYDVVIVGSDQVWRIDGFRGFPNAYWLKYDIGDSLKVAYAASGRDDIKNYDESVLDYISESINQFSYIGVRDYVTQKGLLELTDKRVHVNCDPTFLQADFFKKCHTKQNGKKRVLLLIFSCLQLASKMYRMLRNEFEVISAYDKSAKYSDYNAFCINPFEWVELIASADLVITDRFHGTVFSILNQVQFISLDREKDKSGKIYDLLSRNGLVSQMVFFNDSDLNSNDFSMDLYTSCRKALLNPPQIDYEGVIRDEQVRAKSFFEFLDSILLYDCVE